jgi:DNA-binding response OmpR family regulator
MTNNKLKLVQIGIVFACLSADYVTKTMGKLILTVDDSPDILDCIDIILTMEGYKVVTSQDPENILNNIFKYSPDLILLDIQMGEINGLDVCRELKNNSYTKNIPVVMVSSDDNIYKSISDYGADDFLLKPFDCQQLTDLAAKYLLARVITMPRHPQAINPAINQ